MTTRKTRTRIAPRLRRLVEHEAALPCHPNGRWTKESGDLYYRSTQELRALLAVAREADHTIQWLAGHNMGDVRLENALSRLRRASREG